MGQRGEALASIREAVAIRRKLAEEMRTRSCRIWSNT